MWSPRVEADSHLLDCTTFTHHTPHSELRLQKSSPRKNKIYAGIGLILAVLCIWGWARFIRAKSGEDPPDAAIVAQMIPLMGERNKLLRKMRATKVNGLVASPEALELERLNRLINELDEKRKAVLAKIPPTQ